MVRGASSKPRCRQAAGRHCPTSSPPAPTAGMRRDVVFICGELLQLGVNGTKRVSHTHTHPTAPSPAPPPSCPGNPPPQPLTHKKIKTPDIISHKCGFQAPSVTRHVPQSALAPGSWRGLLEDQNDFTPPPTDRGYPEGSEQGGERSAHPLPPRHALDPPGWVLVQRVVPGTILTCLGHGCCPHGHERGSWLGLRCRRGL